MFYLSVWSLVWCRTGCWRSARCCGSCRVDKSVVMDCATQTRHTMKRRAKTHTHTHRTIESKDFVLWCPCYVPALVWLWFVSDLGFFPFGTRAREIMMAKEKNRSGVRIRIRFLRTEQISYRIRSAKDRANFPTTPTTQAAGWSCGIHQKQR